MKSQILASLLLIFSLVHCSRTRGFTYKRENPWKNATVLSKKARTHLGPLKQALSTDSIQDIIVSFEELVEHTELDQDDFKHIFDAAMELKDCRIMKFLFSREELQIILLNLPLKKDFICEYLKRLPLDCAYVLMNVKDKQGNRLAPKIFETIPIDYICDLLRLFGSRTIYALAWMLEPVLDPKLEQLSLFLGISQLGELYLRKFLASVGEKVSDAEFEVFLRAPRYLLPIDGYRILRMIIGDVEGNDQVYDKFFRQMVELVEAIHENNPTKIKAHFARELEYIPVQILVGFEVCAKLKRFELLQNFCQLDCQNLPQPSYGAPMQAVAIEAVSNRSFPQTMAAFQYITGNDENALKLFNECLNQAIFNLVNTGQLSRLLSLLPNISEDLPTRECDRMIINLVKEAVEGNFSLILKFMEINPKRMILSDALWDLTLDPSLSPSFLKLYELSHKNADIS